MHSRIDYEFGGSVSGVGVWLSRYTPQFRHALAVLRDEL